jgi:hypothetical protein
VYVAEPGEIVLFLGVHIAEVGSRDHRCKGWKQRDEWQISVDDALSSLVVSGQQRER